LQGAKENGRCSLQRRDVKSGNEALTIVQCLERVDASCERELEVKVTVLRCMTLQHGESDVVTCPYSDHKLAFVERIRNDAFEIVA
jgi:hypothetical protein